MAIYRIGRCTAYDQAALFLREGPGHGIPCIRIGAQIRFPLAWIEAHIGSATADANALGSAVHLMCTWQSPWRVPHPEPGL
jgi:hypothetical protein